MYPGTHAAITPDKPAIIMASSGRTVTYGELDDRSAALASAFYSLGLRKGDVVALLAENAPECLEVYWAAIRSGLYITAVNRHLAPAEVAYIVADSDAKILIASATIGDLAADVVATIDGHVTTIAFGGSIAGFGLAYADVINSAGTRLIEQPRGSEMLYSSGTTGRPKGVRPALLPIEVDQPGDPITGLVQHVFGANGDDVYLSPAPMYHAAPLKWSGAIHAAGGTVVVMEKFDAEGALAAIEKYGVTIAQMVPTMFVRLLQLSEEVRAGYDVSSLRLAVHAAAPCPPDVKQAMIDWWGPILVEYYSATEQHGTTVITTAEWLNKRGSVGRSALGPVHICDDDGREVAVGNVGAVYFEREQRPFEYHKDPAKTKAAEHPQHSNWTTVGDLGYVDEDGYVFLTDRKSFMIISGGVNIYPQEVENVLTLHPDIFDVAVIGIPDAEMGQQVKAVVQLRDGVMATAELALSLIDYTRDRIAHFKAPKSVDFVDELPRTATGKLLKREIEKPYLLKAGV